MNRQHTNRLKISLRKWTWSLVSFFLIIGGCETIDPEKLLSVPSEALLQFERFAFIEDGVTSRSETIRQLGEGFTAFEDERILTYQIRVDIEENIHLVPNERIPIVPTHLKTHQSNAYRASHPSGDRIYKYGVYSLVLVFREDGVLERHSLVMAE